jgi:hypothetical protein
LGGSAFALREEDKMYENPYLLIVAGRGVGLILLILFFNFGWEAMRGQNWLTATKRSLLQIAAVVAFACDLLL